MTYTSHGHYIEGTSNIFQTQPDAVARCGGPGLCAACSREAVVATKTQHDIPSKPNDKDPQVIPTQEYVRKRFVVNAVQVTQQNIQQVSDWSMGQIKDDKGNPYIQIKVARTINDRQSKAYIGDWVLMAGSGFKVYTDVAFKRSFDLVSDKKVPLPTTSEKLQQISTVEYKKFADPDPEKPEPEVTPLVSRLVETSSHGPTFAEPVADL